MEMARATIQAFTDGKIELAPPKPRTSAGAKRSTGICKYQSRRYTAKSIGDFLGWSKHAAATGVLLVAGEQALILRPG